MAVVSIVDRELVWLVAVHGVHGARHVARNDGLCLATISSNGPSVVQDALNDPRVANDKFVRQHQIRFYAAAPIVTSDGYRLGSVAVMDTEMRSATDEQLAMLEELAAIVMQQMDSRLSSLDAVRAEQRRRGAAEFAREDAQLDRDTAQQARDDARRDRNAARLEHHDAQLARDDARRDRDEARLDRDDALRDRDSAEHERDAIEEYATVLQKTLLPPALPEIEGLSLAAHYHPASPRRVGGDFYDVFALGGDRWAFFIGDVEGHGVEAAVATSLIRYTLRSLALHHSDPTRVLAELNAVLLRELHPRRFCTVFFGIIEPRADGQGFTMSLATGGHPPALLLDCDSGNVEHVRSPHGMLVGASPQAIFDMCSVNLRAGQTLSSTPTGSSRLAMPIRRSGRRAWPPSSPSAPRWASRA